MVSAVVLKGNLFAKFDAEQILQMKYLLKPQLAGADYFATIC